MLQGKCLPWNKNEAVPFQNGRFILDFKLIKLQNPLGNNHYKLLF